MILIGKLIFSRLKTYHREQKPIIKKSENMYIFVFFCYFK